MISINNVSVSFGSWNLLDCINFHISETDKIGLVGKNGAGKSTLMKLITGEQVPSGGSIDKPSSLKIGYLPQIMEHHRGHTVLEEALSVFDYIHEMEGELSGITAQLAERTDYESAAYAALIERMNQLNDRLALESGLSPRAQAEKVLFGLGFKADELDRLTETFSQGWNMRIELAKILLSQPDVLLLDEPTNHLDIESIEWFEDYLKAFRGAVLLVSHDRQFLDNVTTRTVEILLGHVNDYKVPYSQYVTLRAERIAQQTAAYENQQRMIEKTEDFINRFRYKPTKSNQVQSRIKALEKLERIEIDESDNATLSLKFPPAQRSGDVVFKGTDLTVGYPQKVVFRDAQIEIKRGEKVALIGRNGEGKTTLMRVIMGELEPKAGEAKVGHNVKIGYYAQNQEDILDPSETVFGTLDRIAVGEIRTKLRDLLGAFLFKGEDIDKKVSVLSGGERARLGMAKLMLSPYNVLALDEPTNHMDIRSKDILKQALKAFDGTLIVVSHDRDFLDGLVDKLYEFRDGKVTEHLGSVQDFLQKRKLESLQELERKLPLAEKPVEKPVKEQEKQFQQQKFVSKEQRKLQNRVSFLEKEIARREGRMGEIEKLLSTPGPQDDVMELTREYLELKRALDADTDEWTTLMEQLDN
ncbi:MAG: ABC-F family ATP-binding cassette domain-containing protein [Candidatus Cryptobacteroides sp.]|nr:ABC-F family ATP-binding cassette domain-containing protein [Candidatus Cryptobacteroides sp.]